jgi:hypothetical protein
MIPPGRPIASREDDNPEDKASAQSNRDDRGTPTWYSAWFSDGSPVAVVHDLESHLVAFV